MKPLLPAVALICMLMLPCYMLAQQQRNEVLFVNGDFSAIVKQTKQPANSDDYYWHAIALQKLDKLDSCNNTLVKALQIYPDNEKLELLLSQVQFNRGQYQLALPTLKKYSHHPLALPMLLSVLEFNNDYTEAIAYVNSQLTVDSLNGNLWSRLGTNYYQANKSDSAVMAFCKALALNPLDLSTSNKLANLYLKRKEYKSAIAICDNVLASDSTNRKFIQTKGLANYKQKNYFESVKCFSFLSEQGDTSFFVLRHLGISQLNIGDIYGAIEQLEKANTMIGKDVEVNYCLGKAYASTDTPTIGLYYINRADSLMQPNAAFMASLYMAKCSIYEQMGDYNKAIECIKIAYDYDPKPQYLFYMASIFHYQMNNNKKALDYYSRFLGELPPVILADTSSMTITEKGGTLNMRKMAERNASAIKEELFFNQKQ